MNDPYFYPLGEGGVDFPAIVSYLKSIGWRGHLNVELDTSPLEAAQGKRAHYRKLHPQRIENRALRHHDQDCFSPAARLARRRAGGPYRHGRRSDPHCGEGRTGVGRLRHCAHRVGAAGKMEWCSPGKDLGDINDLGLEYAWSHGAAKAKLLAPVDLQCVKACG